MTTTQENKRSVVPLIEGAHDDVQVVRLGGDRFQVTVQQAIDFLSHASNAVIFQTQFTDLMEMLYGWVDARKQKIASAYVSIGREGLMLLIVQKEVKADDDLEDEMVALDLDVANAEQFDLVPFNTLLVPNVSDEVLQSFLSSGQVIKHQVNAQ